VIRSGRRNIQASLGSITSLDSLVRRNVSTNVYELAPSTSSKVVSASAQEFKQSWKVKDVKKKFSRISCNSVVTPNFSSSCACVQPFMAYLISSNRLFTSQSDNVTVGGLITDANSNGYSINAASCPILSSNYNKPFYALTSSTIGNLYRGQLGDCSFSITTYGGKNVPFNSLQNGTCIPATINGNTTAQLKYNYTPPAANCSVYDLVFLLVDGPESPVGIQYYDCNQNPVTIKSINESLANINGEYHYTTECISNTHLIRTLGNNVSMTPNVLFNCGPAGGASDSATAFLTIDSCQSCTIITDNTCKSIITDTITNPYLTGQLGNWRTTKAYAYYASRTENDPAVPTNIRRNGTFATFAPFWISGSNGFAAQLDSTKWVWNQEMTSFNEKGFETENRDPLGRYNSGLYGYNLSLPTAVAQNARLREVAFDGFEDYAYDARTCDTACSKTRHLDFTPYLSNITSSTSHSGRFALQLNAGQSIGLSIPTTTLSSDTMKGKATFPITSDACSGVGFTYQGVRSDANNLVSSFGPLKGQKMLLGIWVREGQGCNCINYSNNKITIDFAGGAPPPQIVLRPSGAIIEGWQRYEAFFTVPSDASLFNLTFTSTGTATVFFDDLRMQPFNANLKSFVYDPTNLRLMAELDENNYATYYEYDDDGTLNRVKKETVRGIKTIKETHSALLKQ
jgi:hypothetical protein